MGQFSSDVIRLRVQTRKLSGKATRVGIIVPTYRMRPHIVRAFEHATPKPRAGGAEQSA